MKKQNQGITLITLVITIIILLILAGISISALTGKNGIIEKLKVSKIEHMKAEAKENIYFAIQEIQIQEMQENKETTLQSLYDKITSIDERITVSDYIENEKRIEGIYNIGEKSFKYTVDEFFNIIIEGEVKEKFITFSEIQWENQKAKIQITTKISKTIEYQINGILEEGWTQGDFVTGLNLHDIVYARLVDGEEVSEPEKIEIRDNIKPEEFEIEVVDITGGKITIQGNTVDNQSGISNYTYVVKNELEEKVFKDIYESVYEVSELKSCTEYIVYMLAYDNAGNERKSNEITIETEEFFDEVERVIEGESLIDCIEKNELQSGNYLLKVNEKSYSAEIYNYNEDMNYLEDTKLGKEDENGRMIICKYNKNMTIKEGVKLTTKTARKGLFLYVAETLENNGEISMSGKGANAVGEDVYLYKNMENEYKVVTANGAFGGNGASVKVQGGNTGAATGANGKNGEDRETGGGAGGDVYIKNDSAVWVYCYGSSGSGSRGTSYSGGVGGQSISQRYSSNSEGRLSGNNGQSNGGDLAGGLLIIRSNVLKNLNGNITANSLKNGNGGGSINIFIRNTIEQGVMEANGLGKGGNGTVTILDNI